MTRPIYEPNTTRDLSSTGQRGARLFRRPAPIAASSLETEWIRFLRFDDYTITSGALENIFTEDDGGVVTVEESDVLTSMQVSGRSSGGFDRFVVEILEPGVYTCRGHWVWVTGFAALSPSQGNIELAVLQQGWASNQRYEYTEISDTFPYTKVSATAVVTEEDIRRAQSGNLDYVQPRVTQRSGSSEVVESGDFMIWRLPTSEELLTS